MKTSEESQDAVFKIITPDQEGVIWYEKSPDECNDSAKKLVDALENYRNAEIKAWQDVDHELSVTAQNTEVRKQILPFKRDYEVAKIKDKDANHNYNKLIQGINAEKLNIKTKETNI